MLGWGHTNGGALMSKPIQIINCHIHTFTTHHTPWCFPHPLVAIFRVFPFLIWLARPFLSRERIARLEAFHKTGAHFRQWEVLREVLQYYPDSTRFVVLPMDMEFIGHGPISRGLEAQHNELAELARHPTYGPRIIPFATWHSGRQDAFDEFRRMVDKHDFRGLKLYNKLGYAPDHDELMRKVYPLCRDRGLPVMAHCSRGGVYHKDWGSVRQDNVTAPKAWKPVLEECKDLKVCLAHFGGPEDWLAHIRDGFNPDDPEARSRNWVCQITDMIESGDYDNLWTDISYTVFTYQDTSPLVKLFMQNEKIRSRGLFGSDFYMTRQEALSEKAMSIRLRETLGEACFRDIAERNPRIWLGEPPVS